MGWQITSLGAVRPSEPVLDAGLLHVYDLRLRGAGDVGSPVWNDQSVSEGRSLDVSQYRDGGCRATRRMG